jgi:hypothetical protein
MSWLEPSCALIVATFVVVRVWLGPDSRRFLLRLLILMTASWLGENSVIHAYGFYGYHDVWSVFVDQVPLMIVVIWPVVILSAWELARSLTDAGWQRAVCLTFFMVFADAWLIEPIAVQSGLWAWTEPGLFQVPPIGVLGWAFFALGCVTVFEIAEARGRGWKTEILVLLIAPILTHVLLLMSWWILFRWVNVDLPPWPAVVCAWGISLMLAGWALKSRARTRVSLPLMLPRIPAAGFFFLLLGLYGSEQTALWLFAIAFAPPYLALTPWTGSAVGGASSSSSEA